MRQLLNIPHSLSEINIDTEQQSLVATMATEDPSAGGNPIKFTADQYQQIFINAVQGTLWAHNFSNRCNSPPEVNPAYSPRHLANKPWFCFSEKGNALLAND